eukprot:6208353-Pleurochrysis_carterae.AAC.1
MSLRCVPAHFMRGKEGAIELEVMQSMHATMNAMAYHLRCAPRAQACACMPPLTWRTVSAQRSDLTLLATLLCPCES